MNSKYTVILVAYKEIPEQVEAKLKERMLRYIDSPSDIQDTELYGISSRGGFNTNIRENIYFDWYKKEILEYLSKGYKLVLMEVPHSVSKSRLEVLNGLDDTFGENLLVLEHDDI